MIWLWMCTAAAATLHVGSGGDYATIAEAVSAASSGDTLEIAAGTYAECVDTAGKNLDLAGAGADRTVLDGTGCGAALTTQYGETVAAFDLALADNGGRGVVVLYSRLSLTRVTLSGMGSADAYGGALYGEGSAVALQDCTLENNLAAYGGAVYLVWYNAFADSGSVWRDNEALSGGAVYTSAYETLSLSDDVFEDNRATGGGGGGLAAIWALSLALDGVTFTGNSASGSGGGAQTYAIDGAVSVLDSVFANNTAGAYGGGLESEWYSELALSGCSFTGNTAAAFGGAIYSYALDKMDIGRGRFCANDAPVGGAVASQWAGEDTTSNTVFVENTAETGGALYRYADPTGSIWNNTFAGDASTSWGGAYYADWYAYGDLRNNIFAYTASGTGAYAADAYDEPGTTVAYNGWSENLPVDAGGYFYVESGLDGNLSSDPGFVAYSADGDCADDDLRLATGSAFRDAGDPALLDPDASVSDLGAWGGPAAPVEDADGDGYDSTTDCDDTNAEINPGALEYCNGIDDNCDGAVDGADSADANNWVADADGDGYGDDSTLSSACEAPDGAVIAGGDCDDADPTVSPAGAEICGDGIDQDCTGADLPCEVGDPAADTGSFATKAGCGCAAGGEANLIAVLLALGLAGARRRLQSTGGDP